jgi:hypothetical protein
VERHTRLAATFFRQAGPATVENFTTWTALSQRDAKAAMQRLPLVPVAVEGFSEEAWVLEDELSRLREPVPPTRGADRLGDARHMFMRGLFEGDRLVGLWEFDPEAEAVVFGTFDTLAPKRRKQVQALAEDVGTFLREELGHARAFVIDTDEAIRGRAALVKAL